MSSNPLDLPPEQGGPPPEVRQQILARAADSLEGIVPDEHREDAVRRILDALPIVPAGEPTPGMQMEIRASRHSGPVPAPDAIAEYDQVVPGAANRMIEMAERDQAAFIAANAAKQKLDFTFNLACLVAGLIGLGLILWAIIVLASGGHDWLGAAVAGIGISGIVTAFVNARHKKGD